MVLEKTAPVIQSLCYKPCMARRSLRPAAPFTGQSVVPSVILCAALLAVVGCSAAGGSSTGGPGDSTGPDPSPASGHPHTPAPNGSSATPGQGGSAGKVGRIVHVLTPGGYLDGLAVTGHTLWATDLSGNRVVRVDASTRKVLAPVSVPDGPLSIVADGDTVWVASYQGDTVRHLASDGSVTATVTTPSSAPCGLAVAGSLLWIIDQSDGKGVVVSTADGAVQQHLATGALAGFATTAYGSVWVGDFEGTTGLVHRLPVSHTGPTSTVKSGLGPIALASGDGSIWVTNANANTVSRIDPATDKVIATVQLPGAAPTGVLVTADGVWVAGYQTNALYRIDPSTNTVLGTLTLPGPGQGIVSVGGHLWVTVSTGDLVEIAPAQGT